MDLSKIGKFIMECRKEKGLTQVELASKLGVTGKTVSRWENGNYMADISLLIPLSKELDVSLNELLSGEKINDENFKIQSEESIANTIMYSKKKLISRNRVILVFCLILLLIFIALSVLFVIDHERMKNNEPIVFSTWGKDYRYVYDYSNKEMERDITRYLANVGEKSTIVNINGYPEEVELINNVKVYVFDYDRVNDDEVYVYAWVMLGQNYYLENYDDTQSNVGYYDKRDEPYKFRLKYLGSHDYEVLDYESYGTDYIEFIFKIQKNFPEDVVKEVEEFYFGQGSIDMFYDYCNQLYLIFNRYEN